MKVATVQEPTVAVVLHPGATAKAAGLQAVAILTKTTPSPPAYEGPGYPAPPPPPMPSVPAVPGPPPPVP